MLRRRAALGVAASLACALSGLRVLAALPAPRRIEVLLRKFELLPAEISAREGETVILVLDSADFAHGFSIPELDLRVDALPGRRTELRVNRARRGRFAVLCDNFCGEGHDRMSGWLLVG